MYLPRVGDVGRRRQLPVQQLVEEARLLPYRDVGARVLPQAQSPELASRAPTAL